MLPRKLQELWDGMEENRRFTLGMISGISDAEFVRREEGEWSVSEILEHLVIAETGTSKLIRKMLKENAGRLTAYPADDSVLTVRETGRSRERMTEAPEVAHPKGSYAKEEILRLAAQVREATQETLALLAGSDPRSLEFPHPFFGSMNLYEWPHRIIREHENQHHPQIERILRSRGK
ncbi:MAG: DinB family protein [Deltaproteobacteria bacterium]|nr:DinB family protein [Deltaproteobacteria bacterium]